MDREDRRPAIYYYHCHHLFLSLSLQQIFSPLSTSIFRWVRSMGRSSVGRSLSSGCFVVVRSSFSPQVCSVIEVDWRWRRPRSQKQDLPTSTDQYKVSREKRYLMPSQPFYTYNYRPYLINHPRDEGKMYVRKTVTKVDFICLSLKGQNVRIMYREVFCSRLLLTWEKRNETLFSSVTINNSLSCVVFDVNRISA